MTNLGYVLVSKEGYEADDILGTLARSASEKGYKCFIATGDRDSLQLANENVKITINAELQEGQYVEYFLSGISSSHRTYENPISIYENF